MKVRDLKALLARMDDNQNVYLLADARLPWEYELLGVAERRDFEDEERTWPGHDDIPNAKACDVFLVQGRGLRVGSRDVWTTLHEEARRAS
jgi:hypothetical protein